MPYNSSSCVVNRFYRRQNRIVSIIRATNRGRRRNGSVTVFKNSSSLIAAAVVSVVVVVVVSSWLTLAPVASGAGFVRPGQKSRRVPPATAPSFSSLSCLSSSKLIRPPSRSRRPIRSRRRVISAFVWATTAATSKTTTTEAIFAGRGESNTFLSRGRDRTSSMAVGAPSPLGEEQRQQKKLEQKQQLQQQQQHQQRIEREKDQERQRKGEEREQKVLYAVRHGYSLGNALLASPGNEWGSDTFRDDWAYADAPLCPAKGREQTKKLREQLIRELEQRRRGPRDDEAQDAGAAAPTAADAAAGRHWLYDVELVLVSPLTRCLQTWEYGVKPAVEFAYGGDPDDDDEKGEGGGRVRELPIPVVALPLLRERVYTCSDTGRPIPVLREEFSDIDWSYCRGGGRGGGGDEDRRDENEPWWYTGEGGDDDGDWNYVEWRPNGKQQWYAVKGEPQDVFDRRMKELAVFIEQRPERCILLVTHWGVLRHWTNGTEICNCGVVRLR